MRESRRRCCTAAILAAGALLPWHLHAQTPARFYWMTLSGANAVPVILNSISGNTNPFNPAHTVVSPDAQVNATKALAGYARSFTLLDRSALAAFIAPMGRLSGSATLA